MPAYLTQLHSKVGKALCDLSAQHQSLGPERLEERRQRFTYILTKCSKDFRGLIAAGLCQFKKLRPVNSLRPRKYAFRKPF